MNGPFEVINQRRGSPSKTLLVACWGHLFNLTPSTNPFCPPHPMENNNKDGQFLKPFKGRVRKGVCCGSSHTINLQLLPAGGRVSSALTTLSLTAASPFQERCNSKDTKENSPIKGAAALHSFGNDCWRALGRQGIPGSSVAAQK